MSRPPRTTHLRTVLWLAAAYAGVLVLVGLFPPRTATTVSDTTSTAPPTPRGDCVVCGIDETCDPETGRCMLVESTPLPCVKGTRFDERAGFCLPEARPTIVPAPTAVGEQTVPPFDEDFPGFGDDENTPDPEETPEETDF